MTRPTVHPGSVYHKMLRALADGGGSLAKVATGSTSDGRRRHDLLRDGYIVKTYTITEEGRKLLEQYEQAAAERAARPKSRPAPKPKPRCVMLPNVAHTDEDLDRIVKEALHGRTLQP